MKRYQLLPIVFLLLAFSFIYYTSYQQSVLAHQPEILLHYIIDDQGNSSPALLELLDFLEIEHNNTLKSIVDTTQKKWLRQTGKERWEMEEKFPEKRQKLINLFDQLGTIKEIKPQKKQYDYVLFFGASFPAFKRRLNFLFQLWNDGIRFNTVVFLGGQRPLDPQLESPEILLDTATNSFPYKKAWELKTEMPQTEIDMMKFVFDQAELPQGFELVNLVFVDTPMQKTDSGQPRRPITVDTINKWLKTYPKPGSLLVISSQPHVGYQDTVARTVLPSHFSIETVGAAAGPGLKTAVYLDNLARWLYQTQEYFKKNKSDCQE